MKKKILLISIALIGIISLITINLNKNKQENQVYEVITYIDGKLAASFPESTSGYKVNNISCTNGVSASFNYSAWRLELSDIISNTTCTIEFESNSNKRFNEYLKDKICETTPTTDDAAKDCLVNENGYRYEGETPNNYVMFNDELWRIIGLFGMTKENGTSEELVKLIRNDSWGVLAWHSSSSGLAWSTSLLQQELNTENNSYLYATDRTCNIYQTSVTKICNFSQSGIKSVAREKIESVQWNVGNTNSYELSKLYVDESATKWIGKVGLMSASDYGYGVLASNCIRSTALTSYSTSSCGGKDWLYNGLEWSITTIGSNSPFGLGLAWNQGGGAAGWEAQKATNFRPSVYLKSSVRYISGTGTHSDPYIIS